MAHTCINAVANAYPPPFADSPVAALPLTPPSRRFNHHTIPWRSLYQPFRIPYSFGLVALVLGATGIYGVVGHTLGARRRETGIRLALGASRLKVFSGTVAAEASAVGIGALVGLFAAWQFATLLSSFLFGVSPTDTAVYGLVLVGVLRVAGAAIVLPAYRSAASNPVDSLREGR